MWRNCSIIQLKSLKGTILFQSNINKTLIIKQICLKVFRPCLVPNSRGQPFLFDSKRNILGFQTYFIQQVFTNSLSFKRYSSSQESAHIRRYIKAGYSILLLKCTFSTIHEIIIDKRKHSCALDTHLRGEDF